MTVTAQPFCFPVCARCRTEPCPRAFVPASPKRPEHWAPNTLRPVQLECDHVVVPWPLVKVFGKKELTVLCVQCGPGEDGEGVWMPIKAPPKPETARARKAREKAAETELPGF